MIVLKAVLNNLATIAGSVLLGVAIGDWMIGAAVLMIFWENPD